MKVVIKMFVWCLFMHTAYRLTILLGTFGRQRALILLNAGLSYNDKKCAGSLPGGYLPPA